MGRTCTVVEQFYIATRPYRHQPFLITFYDTPEETVAKFYSNALLQGSIEVDRRQLTTAQIIHIVLIHAP